MKWTPTDQLDESYVTKQQAHKVPHNTIQNYCQDRRLMLHQWQLLPHKSLIYLWDERLGWASFSPNQQGAAAKGTNWSCEEQFPQNFPSLSNILSHTRPEVQGEISKQSYIVFFSKVETGAWWYEQCAQGYVELAPSLVYTQYSSCLFPSPPSNSQDLDSKSSGDTYLSKEHVDDNFSSSEAQFLLFSTEYNVQD